MEENMLKTSWKQRVVIALVAAILLGSSVAIYVAIILGGNVDYTKMTTTQLETAYEKAYEEINTYASTLSAQHFNNLLSYKSNVKAFNKNTANDNGVTSKDLKEGDGETVTSNNYSAYYIGWCSDETVFDSSFDNYESPTALKAPISVEPSSLIEGWYLGTEGMKIGGVREVTIPGALAYGDTYEICGGYNTPLKFIIYTFPRDEHLSELNTKLNNIYSALASAYAASYSNSSSTPIDYSEYSDTETTSEDETKE
ncbi:FKBP-type peptidyl-prolyl cis-trans isomerase [Candidatus Saccharibacteria bacterium]|nr:FKBP-type peptidyl-prolyl cis-trans isomerase [Candidatus Saccharibacteria bacterium]